MKREILLFFCLIFILFACKKHGKGYVDGTVTETGTGEPIVGATVIFKYFKSNCSNCPYLWDSIYTDSQGYYKYNYKNKINHEYYVKFRDNNHYGKGGGGDITLKKSTINVQLDPFAKVKLRLNKVSSSNNLFRADVFSIYNYSHNGSSIDTIFDKTITIALNKPFTFNYIISSSPSNYTVYTSDPIIAQNKTTITYSISYN